MSSPIPAARARARALLCAAVCTVLAVPGHAAQPPAEFAISASQMQALGVAVQRLDKPGAAPALALPGRVVLAPDRDVVVSAPLDGVVDRLLVAPQDAVKAGQPLLRLVSPSYAGLQVKLMEAAATARLSRQTLAREKELFAQGIVPERRVQEAQAAHTTAAATLSQAEAELRLAGADPATIRRIASGSRLDDALTVRAKSDGVVSSLDARPGQRVQGADPLLRIADPREMWLEIHVAAGAEVARGSEVTLAGRDVVAVVQSVGAVVGESQTTTLRARVIRGAQRLRPGEAVEARVPVAAAGGWTLPLRAVTWQDKRAYVFVRSAKGFVATPVTVLSSAGQSARVDGALKPGDAVAVSAVIALKSTWLGIGGGE